MASLPVGIELHNRAVGQQSSCAVEQLYSIHLLQKCRARVTLWAKRQQLPYLVPINIINCKWNVQIQWKSIGIYWKSIETNRSLLEINRI